jgi:hypothetical protein
LLFLLQVDHYLTHWWKCTGPCQHRKPYFGLVKRAMNRPPGPNDNWFADHQASCNGIYIKIKEPEGQWTSYRAEAHRSTMSFE